MINAVLLDLHTTKVSGCAIVREDGSYLAVINSRCGYRKQKETAIHELKHINRNDFEEGDADRIEMSAHES